MEVEHVINEMIRKLNILRVFGLSLVSNSPVLLLWIKCRWLFKLPSWPNRLVI